MGQANGVVTGSGAGTRFILDKLARHGEIVMLLRVRKSEELEGRARSRRVAAEYAESE